MFQCVGVHQGLSLSKLTSRLSRGGNALTFHKNIHPYFQNKPEPAFRACEILQFFQVLVSRAETGAATTKWISTRISFESWFRYTKLFDLANIHCNCNLNELAICWSIHVTSLKSKIRRDSHCVSSQVLRFVPPRNSFRGVTVSGFPGNVAWRAESVTSDGESANLGNTSKRRANAH